MFADALADDVENTDEILISDDSDLGTVKRVTIQSLAAAIGSGTGTGGFDIAAVDSAGTDIDITAANTHANPLATEAYVDTENAKYVELNAGS